MARPFGWLVVAEPSELIDNEIADLRTQLNVLRRYDEEHSRFDAARAEREVHPGQAAVELRSEKLLRRCRPRREVSQQAINELVDVRTHARTL